MEWNGAKVLSVLFSLQMESDQSQFNRKLPTTGGLEQLEMQLVEDLDELMHQNKQIIKTE
jgi:hypothetical protein